MRLRTKLSEFEPSGLCSRIGDMPRYYFDTTDPELAIADEIGLYLANDRAAAAEAKRGLGDIVREMSHSDRIGKVSVSVRNERGNIIFTAACTMVALQETS